MLTGLWVGKVFSIFYFLITFLIFRFVLIKRPLLLITFATPPFLMAAVWAVSSGCFDLPWDIPASWQVLVVSVLVFTMLCVGYFQAYAMGEFSITFRILQHFLLSPGHRLSFLELRKLYPFEALLERKVGNTDQGLLIVQNVQGQKTLKHSKAGRCLGGFFHWVKWFCNWGDGG